MIEIKTAHTHTMHLHANSLSLYAPTAFARFSLSFQHMSFTFWSDDPRPNTSSSRRAPALLEPHAPAWRIDRHPTRDSAPFISISWRELFFFPPKNYLPLLTKKTSFCKKRDVEEMASFVAWLVLACCMAPASAFHGAISFQSASSFQGTYGPSCVHVQ